MARWQGFLVALSGWVMLCGMAPSPGAPRLRYAALDLGGTGVTTAAAAALPQTDPMRSGSRFGPNRRATAGGSAWRLSVDGGISADSNITNASNDRFVTIDDGGSSLPVELDPSLRKRGGSGREAGVSAGVKLRLSDGAAFAVDAEGRAIDHKGGDNDDISLLFAGGPELTWSGGGAASLQVVASQNWYGGTSYNSGVGLRGRVETEIAQGHKASLSLNVGRFGSGYGDAFAGTEAGATLGTSAALDAVTTGWAGIYGRREWLGSDAYSNFQLGGYVGASRYLGDSLTGTLTAGLSRTVYDAPLLHLSPDRREDWRWSAGARLTTRRPIGLGVYPSLSYSYNRTDGSIEVFDATRHRVRLGVQRSF